MRNKAEHYSEYDPNYAPDYSVLKREYDVVVSNFVLNILPPSPRAVAWQQIADCTKGIVTTLPYRRHYRDNLINLGASQRVTGGIMTTHTGYLNKLDGHLLVQSYLVCDLVKFLRTMKKLSPDLERLKDELLKLGADPIDADFMVSMVTRKSDFWQ
jgi:hypothetical protein